MTARVGALRADDLPREEGVAGKRPEVEADAQAAARGDGPLELDGRLVEAAVIGVAHDATDDAHATGSDAEYWGEKNGGGAKVQSALGAGSKQTEGAAKPLVKPLARCATSTRFRYAQMHV